MNNKMLAAIFEPVGKLLLKMVDIPKIERNDDVIIKVDAIGICGSDLSILSVPPKYYGKPGIVLGHELSGVVYKIGPGVENLKIGDRVVVDPNEYCGYCDYCRMNLTNLCSNLIEFGIKSNGAFAEYAKAGKKVVHKIPDNLPADIATLAEPVACVVNGTRKLLIQPWETIVVLGGGPIGLLFGKIAKLNGANKLILSEQSGLRREIAKNYCADTVVDPVNEDLEEIVKKETGIGADIVIDAVGSLFEEGIKLLRKGGRILLFGLNSEHISNFKQFDLAINEKQAIGAFVANCYFPPAIKLLESGRMELEKLITGKFSLEKIHEGIDILRKGDAIKIIIEP